MNHVKGFGQTIQSVALNVVNVELAPRRHPAQLDGAEICADDFGAGELIGKVDCSDAGAGAEVEDALQLSDDGCPEKVVVEQKTKDVVQEIEVVLLHLIIGEYVLFFTVGVVTTAILVLVVLDQQCDQHAPA